MQPGQTPAKEPRRLGRDTTWLSFNRRVLAQAQDESVPLLERVKFLAIFSSNLDEFFMKRVALLRRRMQAGIDYTSEEGLPLRKLLERLREMVVSLEADQAACYETVTAGLGAHGVRIGAYEDLAAAERESVRDWFRRSVFPILTPLAVDPGHRFPFVSNLSLNLGVRLRRPGHNEELFARLKAPRQAPRMVAVVPGGRGVGEVDNPTDVVFTPLMDIMRHNLDDVFPGMEILSAIPFRVTRGAGLEEDPEEDPDDLLEHMESRLKRRRFADPVRVEIGPGTKETTRALLRDQLHLGGGDVYERSGPIDYGGLMRVASIDRPDLQEKKWKPVAPKRLAANEGSIFSAIRERDVFLHHPYDSFEHSVERFIETAAHDPNVLAIKQTLYRTSRDSPFVESLIHAAEEGKTVACLVELRARFDEDKNVRFARQLEKHGVHVAYGVAGLKTHSKCSIVVRRDEDGIRSYAHIGTGNYHPGTAQLYTDCGVLTCKPDLTADVVDLFNALTGRSLRREYRRALVAPWTFRSVMLERIEREIQIARGGGSGRVIAKMNSLEDHAIIEKLYEASGAGVKITLQVRGFCCLRPGVPGLSENIEVVSIVGRFLEHSRVYCFGAGVDSPVDGEWWIGSADWMSRNLDNRVELVAPVEDAEARARLWRIVDVGLRDHRNAWVLGPDGVYTRRAPAEGAGELERTGAFEALCADAVAAGGH